MTYVTGGQIGERSMWRVSIISETFWGIVNFFVLFFTTLVQPSKGKSEYSNGSGGGPGGPPGGPRRRMGGFGNRGGGGPASPPMGGGG